MKHRYLSLLTRYMGTLVVLLLWLHIIPTAHAQGQELKIYSVSQQDVNHDGLLDTTVIDCAFVTDHDRIYVVDQGSDMHTSTNWQEATDFDNDIWLYDIGVKGSVQLIVIYKIENGVDTAYLYDDQDDDGQVSYELAGTKVTVRESPYWSAQIVSGSKWFLPDGRLNLNVRVAIDGPIRTDRMPEAVTKNWMKHDGQVDVEAEEVAGDDGIARYALRRLLTPTPVDWGFQRTSLWSNEGHYPTNGNEHTFFPFLPVPIDYERDPRYHTLRYFDLPLSLNVDWLHGKIGGAGLAGYPIEQGYHLNDDQYLRKTETNDVSFESPQAYYDLANNHDALPELHVRFFTRPALDPTMWAPSGAEAKPWQSISYDWNLFNPGTMRWDYKVGLGGDHTIDSVVQFPDFKVRMVPFAQLPDWITGNEWKLTTFLAREGEGYGSSEGLYEWQTDTGADPESGDGSSERTRDVAFPYMLGVGAQPPDRFYQRARKGFRGEYHFHGASQPYLYFSPLDHKLHLLKAESGVWNVDDQAMLRYVNLSGGDYLDQWQYVEKGVLRRQLNVAKDYLIYAGEQQLVLRQATVKASSFVVLPPTDHDEWAAMRDTLLANQQDNVAPGDFRSMMQQFSGPEMQISGATLSDYRPTNNGKGFRFVLHLQPGFRAQADKLLELGPLKPGTYVVAYDGTFTIAPLTPPALSATFASGDIHQLQKNSIQVLLRNDGLQDMPDATLELWATRPPGQATLVTTQTVALLAQVPVKSEIEWTPSFSGQWTLTPKIRQMDGRLLTFQPAQVSVLPAQQVPPAALIVDTTSPVTLPMSVVGIVVFAAIAALIFWQVWRRLPVEHSNDWT